MELGTKLKKQRHLFGYSQEVVAEKLGITRPTLSHWESNKTLPDIINLIKLTTLFGLSLDDLLKEDLMKMNKTFKTIAYGTGFKDGKLRLRIDSGKNGLNFAKIYPEIKANVNMETGEVKFFIEQEELKNLE